MLKGSLCSQLLEITSILNSAHLCSQSLVGCGWANTVEGQGPSSWLGVGSTVPGIFKLSCVRTGVFWCIFSCSCWVFKDLNGSLGGGASFICGRSQVMPICNPLQEYKNKKNKKQLKC